MGADPLVDDMEDGLGDFTEVLAIARGAASWVGGVFKRFCLTVPAPDLTAGVDFNPRVPGAAQVRSQVCGSRSGLLPIPNWGGGMGSSTVNPAGVAPRNFTEPRGKLVSSISGDSRSG